MSNRDKRPRCEITTRIAILTTSYVEILERYFNNYRNSTITIANFITIYLKNILKLDFLTITRIHTKIYNFFKRLTNLSYLNMVHTFYRFIFSLYYSAYVVNIIDTIKNTSIKTIKNVLGMLHPSNDVGFR